MVLTTHFCRRTDRLFLNYHTFVGMEQTFNALAELLAQFHGGMMGEVQLLKATAVLRGAWMTDLDNMVLPTLAYELSKSRLQGSSGESTPELRYQSFFRARKHMHHLGQYSFLAERIETSLRQRLNNVALCLTRLTADLAMLTSYLSLEDGAKTSETHPLIVNIKELASDPHAGGQRVMLLELRSSTGSTVEVVYKPRGRACYRFLTGFTETAELDLCHMKACLPEVCYCMQLELLRDPEHSTCHRVKRCDDDV